MCLFFLLLQVNTVAWSSWMRKNNFVKGLVWKFRKQSKGSNDERIISFSFKDLFLVQICKMSTFSFVFPFCFHSAQVKSLTMDID